MAAFLLFVLAVAGGVVVADLVWENTAAGQVTVFHHAVSGYPVGWLLAIAAGLGRVVALLLVASMSSTKGRRARRKQLHRLRRGLKDRAVAPKPDHARLLDEFFGPGEPASHLGGPARPADLRTEGRERRADDHQRRVTPQRTKRPTEPRYQQVRPAHVSAEGREDRAEDHRRRVTGERVEYPPPSRSTSRPGGPLACARAGTSRSRPARGAGGSGARRGSRRQGACDHASVACGAWAGSARLK